MRIVFCLRRRAPERCLYRGRTGKLPVSHRAIRPWFGKMGGKVSTKISKGGLMIKYCGFTFPKGLKYKMCWLQNSKRQALLTGTMYGHFWMICWARVLTIKSYSSVHSKRVKHKTQKRQHHLAGVLRNSLRSYAVIQYHFYRKWNVERLPHKC